MTPDAKRYAMLSAVLHTIQQHTAEDTREMAIDAAARAIGAAWLHTDSTTPKHRDRWLDLIDEADTVSALIDALGVVRDEAKALAGDE